jgi:large subunit ribosomal protein L9
MQIVLTKDIKKIGQRGDIKVVKPGYFRNFLFPQGLAVPATPVRIKEAAEREKKRTIEKEKLVAEAKEVIKKFEGLTLEFARKTSSKGKLYAALQEEDVIAAVLEAVNVKLEKSNISMEHLKEEGEHEITIKLTDNIHTKVKVLVKKEES